MKIYECDFFKDSFHNHDHILDRRIGSTFYKIYLPMRSVLLQSCNLEQKLVLLMFSKFCKLAVSFERIIGIIL